MTNQVAGQVTLTVYGDIRTPSGALIAPSGKWVKDEPQVAALAEHIVNWRTAPEWLQRAMYFQLVVERETVPPQAEPTVTMQNPMPLPAGAAYNSSHRGSTRGGGRGATRRGATGRRGHCPYCGGWLDAAGSCNKCGGV